MFNLKKKVQKLKQNHRCGEENMTTKNCLKNGKKSFRSNFDDPI